jgi:glycosyltransferase involved in cell wall biosynthesis
MNSFDPQVSVCIPVYNCEAYVAETIRSVLGQTYRNIEIIVVDDGSSDSSLQVLKAFGGRINLLRQKNRGASAARNAAWTVAKGAYIQFLDADDILSADKIELQVAALRNASDHVAVCHTVFFKREEDRLKTPVQENELLFINSSQDPVDFMVRLWGGYNFRAWMVQTNAWLLPRQIIERFGGWDETLTLDDDGEFFARMVLNAKGVIKTGGLNYYRKHAVHKENLSERKSTESLNSYFHSVLRKKQYLLEKRNDEPARKAAYYLLTQLAMLCYLSTPALYQKIKAELQQLPDYRYPVSIGGPLINMVANTAGWKIAIRIQQLYQKLTPEKH